MKSRILLFAALAAVVLAGAALAGKPGSGGSTGTASVFVSNPVQSLGDESLTDQKDAASAVPATAYANVPLRNLDGSGNLVGKWANVRSATGTPAYSPTNTFSYTRNDDRFEQVMAYFWVNQAQEYLQSLGFGRTLRPVNMESQDVRIDQYGVDNSFSWDKHDYLRFGKGGVDDAEDAEVILHEYGHAVQDAQVPGYGATAEGGAMGEGFGDFQAGAYFARTSGGFQDTCLMAWDSTSYAEGPQTCIRRMDSTKRYPKDIEDEVHADGEIWSTFLWQVRAGLPGNAVQKSDSALRLVITMHEFLTPKAKFGDAVASLRTAAKALKHPEWTRVINAAATKRGLPLEP